MISWAVPGIRRRFLTTFENDTDAGHGLAARFVRWPTSANSLQFTAMNALTPGRAVTMASVGAGRQAQPAAEPLISVASPP